MVVAAVRPNAATTCGMVGECKVEIMLDSGSSISLIQESTAAAFSTEYNTVLFGLKLVSASGDNIPVLGCMTLPLCVGGVQASHPLVIVQSLIVPVILGLDFLQKYGMVLDFTSNSVKISSQPNESDSSDNIKTVLDMARQVTSKVCAVNVLTETTEDLVDDCAIPLFGEKPLQYDVPLCNISTLAPLLNQYKSLFKTCLGSTNIAEHFIPTTGMPVKVPPHCIPANYRSEVESQIQIMLQEGVIEECLSPWMAPAVFVWKKTGDIRICVDYRELNKKTVKDAYPLPRPDEVQDRLSGSVIFSTLDLRSGYWLLPVNPADCYKTVFCPGPGLFQFCRMPFGLFDLAGLTLHGSKCNIGMYQVKYLGHVFSSNGMESDPVKTSAVFDWLTPVNVSNLCSFLGLASYYRCYIHNI